MPLEALSRGCALPPESGGRVKWGRAEEQVQPQDPGGLHAWDSRALHGGDIWSAARALGKAPEDILDLSASLNPLGPPPGLGQVLAGAADRVCHYPDRLALELREAIARRLGVEVANVLPAAGVTALLRMAARSLAGNFSVVVAPTFGEVCRSLAIAGRRFAYVVAPEHQGFALGRAQLGEIWDLGPGCVWLTNPVSPSGTVVEPEVVQELVEEAEARGVWVVVDEAFVDFVPGSVRAWAPEAVERYEHLVVLRSMTKFYCLAGLRLGYALGSPEVLRRIAAMGEPWSVNTLAQVAGVWCLGQEEYEEITRERVRSWRDSQRSMLEGLGLSVAPSEANYLLCRLPDGGPSAAEVAQVCLRDHAVMVRDASTFHGCGPNHLRVAVAPPAQQRRLGLALRQALGEGREE